MFGGKLAQFLVIWTSQCVMSHIIVIVMSSAIFLLTGDGHLHLAEDFVFFWDWRWGWG